MAESEFGQELEGGNMTDRSFAVVIGGKVNGVYVCESLEIMHALMDGVDCKIIEVTHLEFDRPGPGWLEQDGVFFAPSPEEPQVLTDPFGNLVGVAEMVSAEPIHAPNPPGPTIEPEPEPEPGPEAGE